MKLTSTVVARYLTAFALAYAAASPAPLRAQAGAQAPPPAAMCVNRTNGQVRFVAATDACRTNEARVALDRMVGCKGLRVRRVHQVRRVRQVPQVVRDHKVNLDFKGP